MSTRFRGVHNNPMKYVVYDIIESQAREPCLLALPSTSTSVVRAYVTFVVEGVAIVGGRVVSVLGKGNAV